jgi:hypothetical protein
MCARGIQAVACAVGHVRYAMYTMRCRLLHDIVGVGVVDDVSCGVGTSNRLGCSGLVNVDGCLGCGIYRRLFWLGHVGVGRLGSGMYWRLFWLGHVGVGVVHVGVIDVCGVGNDERLGMFCRR